MMRTDWQFTHDLKTRNLKQSLLSQHTFFISLKDPQIWTFITRTRKPDVFHKEKSSLTIHYSTAPQNLQVTKSKECSTVNANASKIQLADSDKSLGTSESLFSKRSSGDLRWRCILAWKHRKCASIFTGRLHKVVLINASATEVLLCHECELLWEGSHTGGALYWRVRTGWLTMAMTASMAIHLLRLEVGLQSKSVQL